jgi:hypothetical protein
MKPCVQKAIVRAVRHALDVGSVDVEKLALQHAVKAGQLITRVNGQVAVALAQLW